MRPSSELDETGSAAVEFVMLAAVLLVPVVYFIVTVGALQGASFAAAGAADHAAKVFARSGSTESGQAAAERVVRLAMADFGMESASARFWFSCDRPNCFDAGTAVTVTVEVDVPLPLAPSIEGNSLTAGRVRAASTHVVGRFR